MSNKISFKAITLFSTITLACASTPQSQQVPSPSPLPVNQNSYINSKNGEFGLKIFKNLAYNNSTDNVIISPTSIALALSMLQNGSNGSTREEIAQLLEHQGMSLDDLNAYNRDWVKKLTNNTDGIQLSIGNSVWVDNSIKLQTKFSQSLAEAYQARISNLDFRNPQAAATINEWVSQATRKKITGIVKSPIPNDAVLYLINAIYFKSVWSDAFNKQLTTQRPFTDAQGNKNTIATMYRSGDFYYTDNEQAQAIKLPYGKDKRFCMVIILPKNIDEYINKLSNTHWQKLLNSMSSQEGQLWLPKFKSESDIHLNETLKTLGMKSAFESSLADFSPMVQSNRNLCVSEVKHKTFMEVNEEGTEAAAVTSIGIVATSARIEPTKKFSMDVNKPFLLAIVEQESQQILFAGRVNHIKN